MAQHKYHVDKTFTDSNQLHAFLRQYQAVIQRDVSTTDGHIYFSRPTGKWIFVRKRGGKIEVGFYNQCPCDLYD